LKQHLEAIAAIDMFIVISATFQMLYVVIVLKHDRRKIAHFEVTRHPTQVWLALQVTEAFPWDTAPRSQHDSRLMEFAIGTGNKSDGRRRGAVNYEPLSPVRRGAL
jgi:hypothetical protein